MIELGIDNMVGVNLIKMKGEGDNPVSYMLVLDYLGFDETGALLPEPVANHFCHGAYDSVQSCIAAVAMMVKYGIFDPDDMFEEYAVFDEDGTPIDAESGNILSMLALMNSCKAEDEEKEVAN